MVKWLKRRDRDRHGLVSKPTRAISLWPWERHFTAATKYFCVVAALDQETASLLIDF